MTDLREAAQMALDALESVFEGDDKGAEYWTVNGGTYEAVECMHAMRALRARLAQPEQEPVAWMYDWYDETEDIDGVPVGGIINDWISKDYDEAHSPTMGCHNIRPLYTAPPQREWQGLTTDEIYTVWDHRTGAPVDFARAIEAKLKEKNS